MSDAESWTLFHELLIKQAGYDADEIRNNKDMMVSFHAHDDDQYVADFDLVTLTDEDMEAYARGGGKRGGKGGKGGKGSRPTKGPKPTKAPKPTKPPKPTYSPTEKEAKAYPSGLRCYTKEG